MTRGRKPEPNPKQKAFGREYVKDHNATQAYIRAGYSPKGADVSAARLLGNASIRDFITSLESKATERAEITLDLCLNGLLTEAKNNKNSGSARVAAWNKLYDHVKGADGKAASESADQDELKITRVSETTEMPENVVRLREKLAQVSGKIKKTG